MRLEIRTDGVDFVVSRPPLPKNDGDGRQKADRSTGELLYTTELVAMDDSGAEVVQVRDLHAVCDRLESARLDAADAERVAFECWQDAYGAYQVIRDEASAARSGAIA